MDGLGPCLKWALGATFGLAGGWVFGFEHLVDGRLFDFFVEAAVECESDEFGCELTLLIAL